MALDTTTIIMHNRGVSGGPSLVLSLSVVAHMQKRGVSGSLCAEPTESAGAHMLIGVAKERGQRVRDPPPK